VSDQLLREENLRLKRAVEELSILNDLARTIGGSLNSQEVMHAIIRRSLRAINAEQGVITLVDEPGSDSGKTLIRTAVSSAERGPFHLNQALLGWMHLNKKPLLINNPNTDDRFRGVKWDQTIRSLICVPMMVKSILIGTLTVYNKKGSDAFSEDDQRLLSIIAAQSAQIVENARLYEEELRLRKMQEELHLASRIQMDLLPKSVPQLPGYQVAGKTLPAQQVGGDYFDFIKIDEHRWAFCLGDVSGKGLPASLLMANLQATLRGQTLSDLPPAECVRRSNKLLYYSTSAEKFATAFYGILDTQRHTLKFSNAGHDSPYVLHMQKAVTRLQTGGVPLGMLEDFPYEEEEVQMHAGDLLVVYSDGVTEAWNPDEVEFGEQQLAEVLQQHRDKAASDLVDSIIAAVKSHTGSAPQADDITLVVLKRLT
jgi:sigma-B regulation protein RsbU (phosphoserine phosphatase)